MKLLMAMLWVASYAYEADQTWGGEALKYLA
jgi:hypothetical protein